MPELEMYRNGNLIDDLYPLVISTLHFPSASAEAKRKALADYHRVHQLFRSLHSEGDRDDPEVHSRSEVTITLQDLERASNGKRLQDIVGNSLAKHYRDGFLAAHWLTFRIFAAKHARKLNSNGRWEDYASRYLLPSLPLPKELKRAVSRESLRKIVRASGPVAHFWAVATYSPRFRHQLLAEPGSLTRNMKLAWLNIAPASCELFCREAKGFLDAGIAAGLFSQNSLVSSDKLWTLPPQVQPIEPIIDHPDHMIDVDLDSLSAQYIHQYALEMKRPAPHALRELQEQPKADGIGLSPSHRQPVLPRVILPPRPKRGLT